MSDQPNIGRLQVLEAAVAILVRSLPVAEHQAFIKNIEGSIAGRLEEIDREVNDYEAETQRRFQRGGGYQMRATPRREHEIEQERVDLQSSLKAMIDRCS